MDVFTPGEGGYPCIRIPAIVMSEDKKTLFAFAECRSTIGDGCDPEFVEVSPNKFNRDICTKTSTDNGKTWGAL